ncbi:hypothetical protein SLS54_006933 [Diplodia seriata]
MAEALGVASGAAGIVSLSITVCQGIVKYYTAYKGQDEEVSQALEHVLCLKGLLEILSPLLEQQSSVGPEAVEVANNCIFRCTGSLQKFERILKRCNQEAASNSVQEKFRHIGQKAIYPFKKETLKSLKDGVNDCRNDLNTAINVLQL